MSSEFLVIFVTLALLADTVISFAIGYRACLADSEKKGYVKQEGIGDEKEFHPITVNCAGESKEYDEAFYSAMDNALLYRKDGSVYRRALTDYLVETNEGNMVIYLVREELE